MHAFRSLDEKVPRGKVFGNELNLLITFVPEMHYCLYMVKINVLCHIFFGIVLFSSGTNVINIYSSRALIWYIGRRIS